MKLNKMIVPLQRGLGSLMLFPLVYLCYRNFNRRIISKSSTLCRISVFKIVCVFEAWKSQTLNDDPLRQIGLCFSHFWAVIPLCLKTIEKASLSVPALDKFCKLWINFRYSELISSLLKQPISTFRLPYSSF